MNRQEYAALTDEYLTHEARSLYVMCIRRYMDYRTGLTGVSRRVSYQMFKEQLEVRRPARSRLPDYIPTKQALREMIKKLELVGLIEKLPQKKETDPMVFRCCLASVDAVRSFEEQQMNNTGTETRSAPQENPVFTLGTVSNNNTDNNRRTTQYEQHTSVTSVITTSSSGGEGEFAMWMDWQPSDGFSDRLRASGIQHNDVVPEQWKSILGDFVSYWVTVPGRMYRQAQWEHKLLQHVQRTMRGGVGYGNQGRAIGPAGDRRHGRASVAAALGDIDHDFTAD